MAHTNSTPKLQLAQFIPSDKPTWLGDWNSTMLTIDNAVGTVQEEMATVSGKTDTLEDSVEELTNTVNKVNPSNTPQINQVLTNTNSGVAWSTPSADTITYNDGTVKSLLDTLNAKSNIIGSIVSASDTQSVVANTPVGLVSLSLEAGTYIVSGGVQFPGNATGVREAVIVSDSVSMGGVAQHRVVAGNNGASQCMVNTNRFLKLDRTLTVYLAVRHSSTSTLSISGQLEAMRIA